MNKIELHIGKLSEKALKHRSAILLLSVLIFVVDPKVKITFSKASAAGLGISVDPPQTFYIGFFLFFLLFYRLVAIWVVVFLERGTDEKVARRKAINEIEPWHDGEKPDPQNNEQLIEIRSGSILREWDKKQLLWELLLPSLIAIFALITFLVKHYA